MPKFASGAAIPGFFYISALKFPIIHIGPYAPIDLISTLAGAEIRYTSQIVATMPAFSIGTWA